MNTYINNYQNVLRKNRRIFDEIQLIDNIFPSLSDEISDLLRKLKQEEELFREPKDIKKTEELGLQIKRIIKQTLTISEKIKSVQISFPFSQEELAYLQGSP